MNRLFVPSSLEEADAGNMSLAVPDFTNYTTSSYGRYAEYGMPRQALSAISQTNNLIPGNGWPSLPSHNYENSYSMGPDDNSFYSQSIQVQQESRNQRPHSLRSSAGEDTTSQFSQHRLAQQSVRPRLQRNDGSMNSKRSDDTMVSNTSPSHENVIGDVSARLSFVDQQANNYGTSLLPSPTSCTASIGAVNASVVSEYRKSNLRYMPPLTKICTQLIKLFCSTDVVPGSSSATQIPQDYFSQLDSMSNQNSTEDAEGKKARTHSLYQASPGEDELYHCPHEGQLGCSHKPTKLKCNYEYVIFDKSLVPFSKLWYSKYVDSHLRPFRCKSNMCSGVQFSSTACLLRHEREAHGMHGHGNKPHLCTFEGCERSLPDHGFPRRYNLLDHMKRVHDYTGPPSPSEKELALQEISGKRQVGRKRKASSEIIQPSDKKIKITAAPERPLPPPKPKRKRLEITNLRDEWTQRRLLLVQFLQDLRVEDVGQHQFIADKIEELKRLSENFALFDGQG